MPSTPAQPYLELDAHSLWCHQDVNPQFFNTGFEFIGFASTEGQTRDLSWFPGEIIDSGDPELDGKVSGAIELMQRVERELKTAMLLVGARNIPGLRDIRPLIVGELADWCEHWGTL